MAELYLENLRFSVERLSVSIAVMRALTPIALGLAALLGLSGCTTEADSLPANTEPRFESQVGLQLFMWPWESVSRECEFLGVAGIDWVLVSPPQEHIQGDPWWTIYQPVSYQIESRFGTREDFAEMVTSCADHGVEIIADAVINHMTAQASGTGVAGTEFTKYEYPGLYTQADFHDCALTQNNQIANYKDAAQVQTCELLGLSDLNQKQENVQRQILSYFEDLLSLGVAGFRIDAAKHMAAADLKAIIDQLPSGTRIIHEVIRGADEPITPEQYLDSGDVWEFDYARGMWSYFKGGRMRSAGSETRFDSFTPSAQTVSFISNHDTERNGQTLSYLDARKFELATALMLAEDYGQPMLYSSYAFDDYDLGPDQNGDLVNPINCEGVSKPKSDYQNLEWICQHRFSSTVQMIAFRDHVADAPVTEQFSARTAYGFARLGRGYFVVNASERDAVEISVATTLPDGQYRDLLSENTYQISQGKLVTTLEPLSAIALIGD